MPPRVNSAQIAALAVTVTVLGLTAHPRTADAFFCFSFQFGGGPRYSFSAPSGPFGPWYGPNFNNPNFGYGGFPGGYGGPWNNGWQNPWGGLQGAPQVYSPYGGGPPGYAPGYAPMGSMSPWQMNQWQSPWQGPWQSPGQPPPWAGGYPYGPAVPSYGVVPYGDDAAFSGSEN